MNKFPLNLSLREYYAGLAMASLISNERWAFVDEEERTARKATEYADALIAKLSEREG